MISNLDDIFIDADLEKKIEEHIVAKPIRTLFDYEIKYQNILIIKNGKVKFPGRAGKKKADCGSFKFLYKCSCGSANKIVIKSCNNINCPNCFIDANRRSSNDITKRLLAILRYERKNGKMKPHFNHSTFGPNTNQKKKYKNKKHEYYNERPEEMDYINYKKFKKKYMLVLKKYGASGVLFFHAYRKLEIHDKKVIFVYSPHFHFIGNLWIPKNHFENYGFIIKKIRDKNDKIVKLYKEKHLKSTTGYVLSHTTYFEGCKNRVWIGAYSYNKLKKINEKTDYIYIVCEECNEYLYRMDTELYRYDDERFYFRNLIYFALDFFGELIPLREKKYSYNLEKS